jgi:hypothetical protein
MSDLRRVYHRGGRSYIYFDMIKVEKYFDIYSTNPDLDWGSCCTYHLTCDGRWIRGERSQYPDGNGGELYMFVDPPEAARDFLRYLRWLPGELEAYREIASDPERYAAWEAGEFRAPDAAVLSDDGAVPANGPGNVPPAERRTRPLSLREAARLMGYTSHAGGKKGGEAARREPQETHG